MRIEGKRVLLREQMDADADFFCIWYNDPDIMKKCGFTEPVTREELVDGFHKETRDSLWFTVVNKDTNEILGETGLLRMFPEWRTTDLSIILPDPFRYRQGYGSETIQLMFDLAFNRCDFNRVAIGVVGFNVNALAFYESVGFKREGIQEEGYFCDGAYSDFVMMRLLRREYEERIRSRQACPATETSLPFNS